MKGRACFFIFSLLFISFSGVMADDLACIREIGSGYFDLTPLQSNQDTTISGAFPDAPDATINYNICRAALKTCRGQNVIAAIFPQKDNKKDCIQITSTTVKDYVAYQLIDPANITKGVTVIMSNGDPSTRTAAIDAEGTQWSPIPEAERKDTQFYSVVMNFYCNYEAVKPVQKAYIFNTTTATLTIDFDTDHGCPMITLDQISQFIDDNKIIFTVAGCLIGLLVAFLGLKLFLPTLFIAGFVSGFFITLLTFFGYIVTTDSRESTKWILFVFALILGTLFGFLLIKANKFGIFIIGCWLGTIISLLLYNAILYKIHTDPAELVLLITLGVLGLGSGLLALKFYKHVIIIATSLGGSYGFVRALSLVIGYFPNELEVIKQIQLQEYDFSVNWQFYVYMNGVFLLTLFSIWVQYKIKKRTEANELDFDAEYFKKVDV